MRCFKTLPYASFGELLVVTQKMGFTETVRLLENGCVLQHRHRLGVAYNSANSNHAYGSRS